MAPTVTAAAAAEGEEMLHGHGPALPAATTTTTPAAAASSDACDSASVPSEQPPPESDMLIARMV